MTTTDSPLLIRCGNEEIEQVMEFKYFGSIVENTGSTFKEIMTRVGQGNATFNRLKFIWKSRNYSTGFELGLFNSYVIPVLLFAAKSWSLNEQQEKRILVSENNCFEAF